MVGVALLLRCCIDTIDKAELGLGLGLGLNGTSVSSDEMEVSSCTMSGIGDVLRESERSANRNSFFKLFEVLHAREALKDDTDCS